MYSKIKSNWTSYLDSDFQNMAKKDPNKQTGERNNG